MKQYLCKLLKMVFFFYVIMPLHYSSHALGIENRGVTLLDEQDLIIEGTVIASDNSLPLAGVNIMLKGDKGGTSTDFDGNFILKVKPTDVLVITYVGFLKQEIPVEGKTKFNIILQVDTAKLDEVTVVAYGQQKKESVVASITTVKPQELKIPSSNLTASFSGRIPGVISYQTSGEPGNDNAEFFIRGVSTFGYRTSPLILIDGMESSVDDLARMDVDDIESFSIMKDASAAALYGSRGANGVILVNTKEGKEGKAKISFKYETYLSSNVKDIEFADPVTYMNLWNEAVFTSSNGGEIVNRVFTQNEIDNVQNNVDPQIYPSTDWYGTLFKDHAINKRLNLNVSGGGKVAKYYLSGTYTNDTGILNVDERNNFNSGISLNKIQIRSNNNINITPSFKAKVQFYLALDDYTGPLDGAQTVFDMVGKTSPVLYPAYYEPDAANQYATQILFGNYLEGADYINPYAESVKGYRDYTRSKLSGQINLSKEFSKDFNVRLKVGYDNSSYFQTRRQYRPFYYNVGRYDKYTGEYTLAWLNEESNPEDAIDYSPSSSQVSAVFYLEGAANYNKQLNDDHLIGGTLVYTMREEKNNTASNLQNSLPNRNLGLAGRLNYAYKDRYFVEGNFGYNGSERFSEDHRFGFFPSIGTGWYVSKEKFWEPLEDVVNKFRIRSSYGLVGNDAIGSASDRFFYLSEVNLNNSGNSATFGEDREYTVNGVAINRYANSAITWENAEKFNLAVDLGLFNNKIDITAEYFFDKRHDIFMERSEIPASLGLSTNLYANSGEAESRGFEFSLKGNHHVNKDFWIQTMANFTYATSEFLAYDEPDYTSAPWRSRIGQPIRQNYGYVAERLFYDEDDVLNSPLQIGVQNSYEGYGPGDIKYKDINRDGVIDSEDRVPIGYPSSPEINYGFGFSTGYKNWDFSCFFNGIARTSFFIDSSGTQPFYQYSVDEGEAINQLLDIYAQDHWSEDNKDPYALYPRLTHARSDNNRVNSTWWLRDGSYLRLRQVELGYNISKDFIKSKLPLLQSGRLYCSATNLFTISKFDLWDVSLSGDPYNYPVQKVFNLGIRLEF
ncbi:TonB-dependent receptor [Algibacter sp. L4_22]|uniref:SusC/RagA family TonB-linked outer membrane protein n=1 Tax=Algibacter sp. L4_22 TaxID=2942477 RepID=UPI00201B5A8A|nr:TonB-dependent receptor [Algibacter sp. L4_22]MCL5130499.1 TonB-dependent receptor [Algibacter sp. L4_22]